MSDDTSAMASVREAESADLNLDSTSDAGSPLPPFWVSSYKTKPRKLMSSLRKQAENVVLKQLTKAIDGQRATARYCCGGRVLTALSVEGDVTSKNKTSPISPPIVLRWDDLENDSSRRLRLPIATGTSNGKQLPISAIDKLLLACNTSGTLSRSQFCVDLDPHYLGILDVVARTLLPGAESSLLKERPEHRGVSAQLTHLQIHSGPSNGIIMFLPPLPGNTYLGKLLICLPTPHQGGQLEIFNAAGHSTTMDWSSSKPTDIQWAAFIGDCEHKMHPMQNGHQITLVYNLRVTDMVGVALQNPVLADSSRFPLYEDVRRMLEHPGFMKEGGKLGFYCRHPYSHTSANAAISMPYALQGVDLVIYNVFSSLGLKVNVRPLLDISELDDMDEWDYEREKDCYQDQPWLFIDEQEPSCDCCVPRFPSFEEWKAHQSQGDNIGTEFQTLKFCETGEEAAFSREDKESISIPPELQNVWKWKTHYDIKWLNEPEEEGKGGAWELALHNYASTGDIDYFMEKFHSHVVMLIRVPKMMDRNLTVKA